MRRKWRSNGWKWCVAAVVLLLGFVVSEVENARENAPLPSPYYQSDGNIEYFPPAPEFALSEQAATAATHEQTE